MGRGFVSLLLMFLLACGSQNPQWNERASDYHQKSLELRLQIGVRMDSLTRQPPVGSDVANQWSAALAEWDTHFATAPVGEKHHHHHGDDHHHTNGVQNLSSEEIFMIQQALFQELYTLYSLMQHTLPLDSIRL